ncbi:hypothetical protein [Sinomicrobium sp. M5D2P17]
MNPTHIHLLITHLAIYGCVLGAIVLLYALWSKSDHTKIAAYILFIISSVGAAIAYVTGESAEETVENIPGIDLNLIDRHEDFASIALIALIVLGIVSVAGIFVTLKVQSFKRTTALIVLFISLIDFGIIVRTGYLGGQIRHSEIRDQSPVNETNEMETTQQHSSVNFQ